MAEESDIYLPHNPGDLITAEDWNALQQLIKDDIQSQVQAGVEGHTNIDQAGNADKLDGKSLEEISADILEQAMAAIPGRTGYLQLFKKLEVGEEKIIQHGLKACPLVDTYQLDYFQVVCAIDEEKNTTWTTFYLYHTSEKKIRQDGNTIEIEITDGQPYKYPFKQMLEHYKVEYTDDSSLGDLETEFWKAFFSAPNDEFDFEQFCHSPWFEHCCREERTVGSLKKKGDWDDLWFQMRPRKTVNYPFPSGPNNDNTGGNDNFDAAFPSPAPTQIGVNHYDFDTFGITLLSRAVSQKQPGEAATGGIALQPVPPHVEGDHLKVMLLLKV